MFEDPRAISTDPLEVSGTNNGRAATTKVRTTSSLTVLSQVWTADAYSGEARSV